MARGRSLSEFQEAFSDETRCAAFLFKRRWPGSFVCPACSKPRGVALHSRPRLFECLDCGRQTSITAGTAMHRSKLPLTTWFWAAHLMATHSNGMWLCQLSSLLGATFLGCGASRLSSFQDTERDGCPAHMMKAPCSGGNVLAHARSRAEEVPEFVVTAAISSC